MCFVRACSGLSNFMLYYSLWLMKNILQIQAKNVDIMSGWSFRKLVKTSIIEPIQRPTDIIFLKFEPGALLKYDIRK